MPTTTNYGWTTPADTDLVKDGAAAIRTLGSSVDTTVKNLNPETTTGDISYRSATSNVNTRLALGTAGQVLTVNSGATAPEWATPASGGMTLLSTTTLSGTSTTISSISGAYTHLHIYVYAVNLAANSAQLRIAPNGTTNICDQVGFRDASAAKDFRNDYLYFFVGETNAAASGNTNNAAHIQIYNYSNTNGFKNFKVDSDFYTTARQTNNFSGGIQTTSAISSLVFSGGTFNGGTVLLYGVK